MKIFVAIFFSSIILGSVVSLRAQPHAQNLIYMEVLGNGLTFSVNYERRVADNFSARAGIGYITTYSSDFSNNTIRARVVSFPLLANYLLGLGGEHNIQVGLGVMLFTGSAEGIISGYHVKGSDTDFFLTANVGYRYHPKDGGVFFTIGFTPFFYGDFSPWGGAGIGYAF